MLFIGADGSKGQFYTKKNITKNIFTCIINDKFNILLYPNASAFYENTVEDIAYVVPVHMPSFVHRFCKNHKENQIDKLFDFNNENERQKALLFYQNIKDKKIRKLNFI